MNDPRPIAAIGHIGPVLATDVDATTRFYTDFGLRKVASMGHMTILELRGGTHLIVRKGTPRAGASLPFDLMVDDIEAARDGLIARGHQVGPVRAGGIHRSFAVADPDGQALSITSSHAVGPV